MFITCYYLNHNGKVMLYRLEDSTFTTTMSIIDGPNDYYPSIVLKEVILQYYNRKMPVAKNIAKLYTSWYGRVPHSLTNAKQHAATLGSILPAEIEYVNKIFPCVKRLMEAEIKRLQSRGR